MDNPKDADKLLTPTFMEKLPEPTGVRFFALFLFILSVLSASALSVTSGPLSVPLAILYKQEESFVALVSTIQMIVYPVCTILATALMRKVGLQRTIQFGAFLLAIGAGIRCLLRLSNEFYWVLVGSVVIGIGRPFVLNFQADLAMTFFGTKQRTQVAGLLNFLMIVSMSCGVVFSTTMFDGYDQKPPEEGMERYNLIQEIEAIFGAFVALIMLTFPNRKGEPPLKVNFCELTLKLMKNCRYLPIFLGFATTIGSLQSGGVVQPFLTERFGFSPSDNGYFATVPMVGGMLFMPFLGPAYKLTGRFKPLVVTLLFFCMGGLYLDFLSLKSENLIIVLVVKTAEGAFMMPVTSYLIEWGAKAGQPVDNSFSTGLMFSGANLMAALLAQVQVMILGKQKSLERAFYAISFVVLLFFITLVCCAIVKEPRTKINSLQVQTAISDESGTDQNLVSAVTDLDHNR